MTDKSFFKSNCKKLINTYSFTINSFCPAGCILKKIILILFFSLMLFGCKKNNNDQTVKLNASVMTSDLPADSEKTNYLVTFIELGSVKCVPCKMMQPVMKQIEEKFKGQVNVVFYDVWTEKDAPRSKEFGIRVIPTQVFLDQGGLEFFRHEGYFPMEEVEKILNAKGVK
jgi:thioredoxin 1